MGWLKNDELTLSRYLRFLLSSDGIHGQLGPSLVGVMNTVFLFSL